MGFHNSGGGGGGERLIETVLWTNSAPTSTFAAQAITLSDDMNNYDYLKVVTRESTSNSATVATWISVSDFKTTANVANSNQIGFGVRKTSSNSYGRFAYYVSDTSLSISNCYGFNAQSTSNTEAVPIQIYGVKKSVVNDFFLNIPDGYVRDYMSNNVFSPPTSGTGYWHAYIVNTKPYSTLTVPTNTNWLGVVGFDVDGTLVQLTTPSTQNKYTTVDISAYDYIWVTQGGGSSHTFTMAFS